MFGLSLLGVFIFKFIIIILLACLIFKFCDSFLEAFVSSWILTYLVMIFLMFILSLTNALNRKSFIICIGIILTLLIIINYKNKIKITFKINENTKKIHYFLILIILAIFLFLSYHSLYYFDTTWDAQTYGLPRILLYSQKQSILIKMSTEVLNIFTNEWNGELNALFYRIMTDTDMGISFANIENFIYGTISIVWVCQKLRINLKYSLVTTILYITMPVVVFLSYTCKGDLLPVFLLPVALGFFVKLKEKCYNDNFSILLLIATLGLMAGAKITMVPFAGLFIICLIIYLLKTNGLTCTMKKYFNIFLASSIFFAFGCLRYVLNIFQYGNPFKRVEVSNEAININLSNALNTIFQLIKTFFYYDNLFTSTEPVWALNKGFGLLGVLFLVIGCACFLVRIYTFKKSINSVMKNMVFVFPFFISLIFFILSNQWQPWSVRYYAPWIGVVILLVFRDFFCAIEKMKQRKSFFIIVTVFMILCVVNTMGLTLKQGEVTAKEIYNIKDPSLLEKKYAFHSFLLENPEGKSDIYDFYDEIKTGKKILICNGIDESILYLFGNDNDNDITLCNYSELLSMNNINKYDVISVSKKFVDGNIQNLLTPDKYEIYSPEIINSYVFVIK